MKDKLLFILKPMPLAVHSANLEEFRQSLYAIKSDDVKPLRLESSVDGIASSSHPTVHIVPTQSPDCNRCAWCGIWMPLLINQMIVTPTVLEASSPSKPDPIICQLAEVDRAEIHFWRSAYVRHLVHWYMSRWCRILQMWIWRSGGPYGTAQGVS